MALVIPGVLAAEHPLTEAGAANAAPAVFDSPHSGADYPEDFAYAAPFSVLRRAEDAFVDELYVRGRFRGRGIGTRALEAAAELCRSNGVCALHLEVERSNTRAQSVYRRTGFVDRKFVLMTRRL